MHSTTLTTVVDGVVAVAVIIAGTVLLALHALGSTAALAVIGIGVTLVSGTTKTLLALKVPTNTSG
jgi:hypothetical protein